MLNCNTRYYTNLLCYIFLSYYLYVCMFPHAWKYFNLVYFYILLFSLKKNNHVTPQPHTIHHRIDLIEDSTDKKDRRECLHFFWCLKLKGWKISEMICCCVADEISFPLLFWSGGVVVSVLSVHYANMIITIKMVSCLYTDMPKKTEEYWEYIICYLKTTVIYNHNYKSSLWFKNWNIKKI